MAEKPSTRRFAHDAAVFARQNVNVIVLAVVAITFIAILQEVAEGEITYLDTLAYQFLSCAYAPTGSRPSWRGSRRLPRPRSFS